MKFLILHGAFGTPDSNWFRQLEEQLEMLGQDVILPRFPIEDWNDIIVDITKKVSKSLNLD